MCGVVAALDSSGFDVRAALDKMKHRGIRQKVVETRSGTMGHVRLPIVGLGTEWDQPVYEDGRVTGFVGEVLEFRDQGLECDLPIVVREWFNMINYDGFWSIMVIDVEDEILHVVCDYLAQKPTYYRTDIPAAASEIDALVDQRLELDQIYLSAVVKWGYCPEPRRTPYKRIKRVLPGEHVVLADTGLNHRHRIDALWPDPKVTPRKLKQAIERAVDLRLTASDVPVALLLSGGLDSSIVWHLAKRLGHEVHSYCVGEDEFPAAAEVDPRCRLVMFTAEESVKDALSIMQEPIDLGSLLPQVALSKAIGEGQGIKVALTGDGADEFFGGYGRASRYDSQRSDVFHELVCWHLPRLDRVMMKNCVEVRSPFLARDVAQMALALPWEDRRDKRILREIFRGLLPEVVVQRAKRPLRTPEVAMDREGWSKMLVDMFVARHGVE